MGRTCSPINFYECICSNLLHIFVKIYVPSPDSLNFLKTMTISLLSLTQEIRSRCLINTCGNLKNYEKKMNLELYQHYI